MGEAGDGGGSGAFSSSSISFSSLIKPGGSTLYLADNNQSVTDFINISVIGEGNLLPTWMLFCPALEDTNRPPVAACAILENKAKVEMTITNY